MLNGGTPAAEHELTRRLAAHQIQQAPLEQSEVRIVRRSLDQIALPVYVNRRQQLTGFHERGYFE